MHISFRMFVIIVTIVRIVTDIVNSKVYICAAQNRSTYTLILHSTNIQMNRAKTTQLHEKCVFQAHIYIFTDSEIECMLNVNTREK